MIHHASPAFWKCYRLLPAPTRNLADRLFKALKSNPDHPSLQLKQLGSYWSARVGLHYRTLGIDVPEGILWIWIGSHAAYDRLIH